MATAKRSRQSAAETPDPFASEPVQQALAPAPVAPNENDEARKSIATINTQLAEFDKIEAGLEALETRHKAVAYDCTDAEQMGKCRGAVKEIQTPRFAVEHARKAAKRPVLDIGKQIDGKAQAITVRLFALETPLVEMIESAETIERNRVADLQKRVREIQETPASSIGKSVAELEQILEGVLTVDLTTFAEFREQAAAAQVAAQLAVEQQLQQARDSARLRELEEEQRLETERKKGIQDRIRTSLTVVLDILPMCRTAARVQPLIDRVEAVVIDESFQEFGPAAREEKVRVLDLLRAAHKAKQEAEEAFAAAVPAPTPAPTPAVAATDAEILAEILAPLPPEVADFLDHPLITGKPTPTTQPTEVSVASDRPTDAEILALLVEHYDVGPVVAAAWLCNFDADAALRQYELPLTA